MDDGKIVIVRACCDLKRFTNLERRDDGHTLVSIGRLVEKKGLRYGIEAFARLWPVFPSLRYRIAGAGPLRSELTALATRLGVAEQIEFTGAVDQDGIARILSEATVMVLPSVRAANGDLDGAPLALQEAMAAGVPVVAARVASIPELIESEREGLLVEPGAAEGLAEAIRRQLLDEVASSSMATAAKVRVTEHFNIRREVQAMFRVWEHAVQRDSGDSSGACALEGTTASLGSHPHPTINVGLTTV